MREFDALAGYPQPTSPRVVTSRTFGARLIASDRGFDFFDGARANGYGGLVDDGRWGPIADRIMREYGLAAGSTVLQVQSEKGFLLDELRRRGCYVSGTETSVYAQVHSKVQTRKARPPDLLRLNASFDLVIAIGAIYTLQLGDAVACLRAIQRIGRRAFVTLAAYENEADYWLLRAWSLLGTTILLREHWLEAMRFAGYDGDYAFVTAKTLNLSWGSLGGGA